MPLWSSYLVKVYAWRTILSTDGVLNWVLDPIGAHGPGYGNVAVWLVMSYLWLPFMIIPIYAGLERIPDSLLSASEDLGASPLTTFRRVILPLVFPAVVAGSIFTFSLTLGDYITPSLVSNNQFIGNVVYNNITNNLPLASAFAMVPIVVMIIYLLIARRARGVRASMRLSKRITDRCCGSASAITLAFIYIPLIVIAIYAFNAGEDARVAAARPHHATGSARRSTTPAPATRSSPRSRSALVGDRDRPRPRHAGLAGGRAPPLLRPRDDLVPRHPADRAARGSSPASRSATPSPRSSAST